MNRRWTVTPDAPNSCWRVFDTIKNKFEDRTWTLRVQAEARCDELNESDYEEVPEMNAEDISLSEDLPGQHDRYSVKHPMAATEGQHLDKRQRVVLAALAGKVKCSGCGKAYHGHSGSLAVGPAAAPVHSIKVTRYDGFETPELTVGLNCVSCGHGGLYTFDGNPLMDAGIVPQPAMTA
tara:strand:+ start:2019 stop:2555 length:537 start_codon:yes stop_codon:yes gene_type:complete